MQCRSVRTSKEDAISCQTVSFTKKVLICCNMPTTPWNGKGVFLLHLGRLTGRERWRRQALQQIQAFAASVGQQPTACTHTLNGWELALKDGGGPA
ncbi:hypothetical protein [Desulfosarcina variabilis]|uniref:hypothetical protein n=1 Tax=Desulfosarcina variabilis TaxID=2300 RepID=UPI003AFA5F8B